MNRTWIWRLRTRTIAFDRPLIMGVLNVTPDSFSDGGRFIDVEHALSHAREMVSQGADMIDVGGESTRPGAGPVDEDEEIRRVLPVVERLAGEVVVSIDTSKAAVARAALEAGAEIVNDVTGLADVEMRRVIAEHGSGAVIMHMQGEPRTMQKHPHYTDVEADIIGFLDERLRRAVIDGCNREGIVLDPGIGFGKTIEHNLILCNRVESLMSLGRPVLIGTSRKSFLGSLTGHEQPADRDLATAVTTALVVERGAAVIRVHDVASTREALSVALAIVREQLVDIHTGKETKQHSSSS